MSDGQSQLKTLPSRILRMRVVTMDMAKLKEVKGHCILSHATSYFIQSSNTLLKINYDISIEQNHHCLLLVPSRPLNLFIRLRKLCGAESKHDGILNPRTKVIPHVTNLFFPRLYKVGNVGRLCFSLSFIFWYLS